MPTITISGESFDVTEDKRLVLAMEEHGIDVLHRCGGHARCTTCRVKITDGEPQRMTKAERNRLQQSGLIGIARLSCQILCEQDMTVEVLMRISTTQYDEPGVKPEPEITPEPQWTNRPY